MARIEKTVFISYRRTDVYVALAVYENLKNHGYDVFFDYRSIPSGDFEQIIVSNIKARAHFLVILTPTALDRCSEPGDWLRREIELAIDEKRNIVPLFFKGFRFGSVSDKLTGKLQNFKRYNGMNVHEDYFDEGMDRLRKQYLDVPLDTVLHPVSNDVQKVVLEEQNAADKALERIENVKELVKQSEDNLKVQPTPSPAVVPSARSELEILKTQAIEFESLGDFSNALQTYYKINKLDPFFPAIDSKIKQLESELGQVPPEPTKQDKVKKRTLVSEIPWRLVTRIIGGLTLIVLFVWVGISAWNNRPITTATVEPTDTFNPTSTQTQRPQPTKTNTPSPTNTSLPPTPTPGMGSTMTSEKDGMKLIFVPGGSFTMGSDTYISNINADERPMHDVTLSSFWIDQTEVTNKMYALCVDAGACQLPNYTGSVTRTEYYGTTEFADYPVLVGSNWQMAQNYCAWAGRRLPTEAEWEKTARGTDASIYPWGNGAPSSSLANYNNNIGDTTEVGTYPDAASTYGALDMSGNVWEWVSSLYKPYPYSATDGRENPNADGSRVLRGGSWLDDAYNIRSGVRPFGIPPIDNTLTIGFRCAMDATP